MEYIDVFPWYGGSNVYAVYQWVDLLMTDVEIGDIIHTEYGVMKIVDIEVHNSNAKDTAPRGWIETVIIERGEDVYDGGSVSDEEFRDALKF